MSESQVLEPEMMQIPNGVQGYLDLEIDSEETIYRFGLVSQDGLWDTDITQAQEIRSQLLQIQQSNNVLCGHNIRRFDRPYLIQRWVELEPLLVVDTLELSVLAFPLQPSHKLQKDYKLSQYSSNNPLEDAQATRHLLEQILQTLNEQPESLQHAYRWLLTCGQDPSDRAYQRLFELLQDVVIPLSLEDLPEAAIAGMSRAVLEQYWKTLGHLPFDDRLSLAALLAWNYERTIAQPRQSPSAWLSHLPSFYKIQEALFPVFEDGLTYQPYFREFNISGFRSPQEEAVQAIIDRKNPLILMATGGGKSLCYQLPALMFYRRQQGLTVCISPLQALMEDQVEDLKEAGLDFATFINGTLQAEERRQRIEQIRDGWKGLLYLSPEQLRSISIGALLKERLPVLWVIDEAHCISQWGHDFRPDYRYVPKFIQKLYAERQQPMPRLVLLTATATADVCEDIKQLFSDYGLRINQEIRGEINRSNLKFEVKSVSDKSEKDKQLIEALKPFGQQDNAESPSGCALVYTTTRKEAERLARMLESHHIEARYYHGKMSRDDKSEVLRTFKSGELNIVTATCAFGMGINRKDVRAVIHHTMSSSLESYIQEAGRAGRDGANADCLLLFNEQDADTVFFLKSLNQLSLIELRNVLIAVRKLRDRIHKKDSQKKERQEEKREAWFWVTPNEIFQTSQLDETFASEDDQRDTKIKVALYYLEQFKLIERAENLSSVVQFNLVHPNPQESCRQFEHYSRNHHLSELQTEQFRRLIYAMHLMKAYSQQQDERFPLERLSDDSGIPVQELTSRIRELQRAGICSSEIPLTLLITKRKGEEAVTDARSVHDSLRETEEKFLEELLPLMGEQNQTQINLRGMATRLDPGGNHKVSASKLMDILEGWQSLKWVQSQQFGANIVRLEKLEAPSWLTRHRELSRSVLDVLQDYLGERSGKDLPLEFNLEDLLQDVQQRTKPLSWTELDIKSVLLWLHQRNIIRLTDGLMLFHQSLKLRTLLDESKKDENKKQEKDIRTINRNYPKLQSRYDEQARRTHLMVEYGKNPDEIQRQALVTDYFSLSKPQFDTAYSYLANEEVKRPVTQADYDRIMGSLNDAQKAIVEARVPKTKGSEANTPNVSAMVVIAGPGSGKTRTIVHRIAYLVKVKRVNPDRILVLAYNRNAVYSLRQRLKDLIGPLAFSLRVFTFHGLALALLGQVPGADQEHGKVNFEQLLKDAIALLERANNPEDFDSQAQVVNVLGTVEYVFVDEYQDVAQDPYRLIQLVSGLGKSEDGTRSVQINLCAIGDDDQTINEFAGANSRYILDFQTEYNAQRLLLTENYRSTEPIIEAANALIRHNSQRCKRTLEEQVRINRERQGQGGNPVRAFQFSNIATQAGWICEQVQYWLQEGVPANEIAIVAHQWKLLSPIRALLEQANIQTYALKNDGIPLVRNWVTYRLIEKLKEAGVSRILAATESVQERFLAQFKCWKRSEAEPTVQTLLKIASILDEERDFGSEEAIDISADDILSALFEFNQSGANFSQDDSVLVTSCHGAKGLEFRKVILLTDGFDSRADKIEGERRLFYVAMTRAKEDLVLCGTQHSLFVQESGINPERISDRSQSLPQRMLYLDLTPGDVKLGHPATQEQQAVIKNLREGEPLMLVATRDSSGWTIRSQGQTILGALSRQAVNLLQKHEIMPGQFQFQPGEVTVRYIYRHLIVDNVTDQIQYSWFVIIPQIRVCRYS